MDNLVNEITIGITRVANSAGLHQVSGFRPDIFGLWV